jgi:hypothetical protein
VKYRTIRVSFGSVLVLWTTLIACSGTEEQRRVAQERTLRGELDGLVVPVECPRNAAEREGFASEQVERARLEVLRFWVDPRAPYRSARAAALALACTPASSAELPARRQSSGKRWEAFVGQGRLLVHHKSLADRSGDKSARACALSSLAELVEEASPKLAGSLRAQARRLAAAG